MSDTDFTTPNASGTSTITISGDNQYNILSNLSGSVNSNGGDLIINFNDNNDVSEEVVENQDYEESSNESKIVHLGQDYTYNEDKSLYYKIVGDGSSNIAVNETNVELRFVSTNLLTDKSWDNNKSDIITYEGIRYEPDEEYFGGRRFFRETLHVLSFSPSDGSTIGTIRASSIYEDEGDTSITTIDNAAFPVQSADGIYKDVKVIIIYYDNDTYEDKRVRTLRLLR